MHEHTMQAASTSQADFEIEVRDPVKHGDGVSVTLA